MWGGQGATRKLVGVISTTEEPKLTSGKNCPFMFSRNEKLSGNQQAQDRARICKVKRGKVAQQGKALEPQKNSKKQKHCGVDRSSRLCLQELKETNKERRTSQKRLLGLSVRQIG